MRPTFKRGRHAKIFGWTKAGVNGDLSAKEQNKNIYTSFLSDGGVDSRSEVCLCSWAGGGQLAGGEILEVILINNYHHKSLQKF